MSVGKTYQKLLKNHFLLVQAIQTGALMGAGDVLAQLAVEKKSVKQYELTRTVRFAFLGAVLVGPAVSVWYKFLQKQFGDEKKLSTALKKMSCDQLIFAPGFLPIFLLNVGLLQGKNIEEIHKMFDNKYMDIILTNWQIWPFIQMINFYFVPLKYQVLLVQSIALLWNTYLSWKTAN